MEFAIGFVTGGVVTGVAAAKSGAIVKAVHGWLAKWESVIKQKMAARAESIKSKL